MANFYIHLFIFCFIVSSTHAYFLSKRYSRKLAPIVWGEKINWNPKIDNFKLLLSICLFSCPIILLKSLLQINLNNPVVNYTSFGLITTINIFCIWFDLKKNDTNKGVSELKKTLISEDLEKLKIKQNVLEDISNNTIKKVNNNYKEVLNLKKETLENLSHIKQDILIIRKETKKNKFQITENFNMINNEISKIKEKLKPQKKVSDIRDKKINKVKSEFKKLVNDLRNFDYYDDKNSVLINKFHGISELESYQILVIFFQRYYNIPEDKTKNIIYNIFNNHFSISLNNGINSGNWANFKKKVLDDIENQTFFSDLMLNYNKTHSTVE